MRKESIIKAAKLAQKRGVEAARWNESFKEEAIKETNKIIENVDSLVNGDAFLWYTKKPNYSRPENSVTTLDRIIWGCQKVPSFNGEQLVRYQRTILIEPKKFGEDGYCGSLVGAGGCLVDIHKCKEYGYQATVFQKVQWNNSQNYSNTTPSVRERWDIRTGQMEDWLEEFQQEAKEDEKRKKNYFGEALQRAKEEGLDGRAIIAKCDIVSMVDWVIEVKEHNPRSNDVQQVLDKGYAWAYAEDVLGSWIRDIAPTYPLLMQTLRAYMEFCVENQLVS